MSVPELAEYIRISKYAQYNYDKKRRETWNEQIDRVMGMHEEKYAYCLNDIADELNEAKKTMKQKIVLGAQRALQFGGNAISLKNARMYNCTASYVDRIKFFQEAFWLSLCGCGVGFSVQKHHIYKLSKITKRDKATKIYSIDDSIEGWADSLGVLLSSFFIGKVPFPEYQGYKIIFDYSKIRPAGALIASSGAKAPGPEGLKLALEKIRSLMIKLLLESSKVNVKLRPIDAYDICMHLSDAVVSGGVRRSATIAIFSKDDEDMLKAKTGNWFEENPQRGRSNNSALLIRSETSEAEFQLIMENVKEFGEPGFIWADDKEALTNPCAEIGIYAKHWETGESGWQVCNLTEINMAKIKTENEFYEACRIAAILGTIQAGYTSFDYLEKVSDEILKKESVLGVSMTGMMDTGMIAFDPKIQKKGAEIVKKTNKEIAKKIGINPAARACAIKPSGTASIILGSASGIHPHHASRYIRRVQANILEGPLNFFKQYNPLAVEKSIWDSNGVTEVINFNCEVPAGSKTKNQMGAIELLECVKLTQNNWVKYGKDESLCVKPWLTHNVSNTIHVLQNEWEEVTKYIYDNKEFFTGIALLPNDGDKDLPQAPFTTVYTPNEIIKNYGDGSLFASGLIVHALKAFDNNLWDACACALGLNENSLMMPDFDTEISIEDIQKLATKILEKKTWIERSKRFTQKYFDGDIKKMTYCLKDVHNWKLWVDLSREYKKVPWEDFHETENNTTLAETVACAGGVCEI